MCRSAHIVELQAPLLRSDVSKSLDLMQERDDHLADGHGGITAWTPSRNCKMPTGAWQTFHAEKFRHQMAPEMDSFDIGIIISSAMRMNQGAILPHPQGLDVDCKMEFASALLHANTGLHG